MQFHNVFLLVVSFLNLAQSYKYGALFYPTNSAYGILAAIAVPLEIPHRNIFVSYNFEANYNLPYTWDIPPIKNGYEDDDPSEYLEGRKVGKASCFNCTASSEDSSSTEKSHTSKKSTRTKESIQADAAYHLTSLITRTTFYNILKEKFSMHGFNGEDCLLRLICEINASELGQVNGVFGSVIHILFTPTTSENENLPLKYYQAEVDGVHEQCHRYEEDCEESILDLFSISFEDMLKKFVMNG